MLICQPGGWHTVAMEGATDGRDPHPPTSTTLSWEKLRDKATEMAQRAYPFASELKVGAAGLTTKDRLVVGCNVEISSYGLTLCAECGLVSDLFAGRPTPVDFRDTT